MSKLAGSKLTVEMQRLKETGKIDGLVGADNVGLIIDHWNKGIEKKRQKSFNKDITARNKYYWKLAQQSLDQVKAGTRKVRYLKPGRLFNRTIN